MKMFGCALMLLVAHGRIPRPLPNHPDWGPEPPVAPYGLNPLPSEQVNANIVFPVLGGKVRWNNDYGNNRGTFLHTGIDIKAPKMTPIVAPIGGILGMKRESFWIYGDNGYVVLGTHLNDDNLGTHDRRGDRDVMFAPGLAGGQHVERGQFIGYVGMSGDATAPHLHFEVYDPGEQRTEGRLRSPEPSLKAAIHISEPEAFPALTFEPSPPGRVRIQGYLRGSSSSHGTITIILLYHEVHGHMRTVTQPTWLKLALNPQLATQLGGWSQIAQRSQQDPLTAILDAHTHEVVSILKPS